MAGGRRRRRRTRNRSASSAGVSTSGSASSSATSRRWGGASAIASTPITGPWARSSSGSSPPPAASRRWAPRAATRSRPWTRSTRSPAPWTRATRRRRSRRWWVGRWFRNPSPLQEDLHLPLRPQLPDAGLDHLLDLLLLEHLRDAVLHLVEGQSGGILPLDELDDLEAVGALDHR